MEFKLFRAYVGNNRKHTHVVEIELVAFPNDSTRRTRFNTNLIKIYPNSDLKAVFELERNKLIRAMENRFAEQLKTSVNESLEATLKLAKSQLGA